MARILRPLAMSMPRVSASSGYEEISGGGPNHNNSSGGNNSTARGHKASLRRTSWLLRLVGVLVLAGAVVATSLTLGRKDNLRRVLLWIHAHTAAGFIIFALLYLWFTVLFLPSALLAACAGAIYGFLAAIPLVWVCAVLGETVSFLLGRFLLRRWVRELTADWPMWTALNAALKEDGWKLVTLLRISPVIPFSILNYGLGSSSLPFSHYFWPSVFGIVPGLIIYVWLGSLAADVTEAMSGHGATTPPAAKVAIIVGGAVSALVVVVLSAVYTKRAIDRRLSHVTVREETQVEEQHFLLGEAADGQGPHHRGIIVSVETPVLVVDSQRQLQQHLSGPSDGGSSSSTNTSAAGGGSGGGGGWLWRWLPAALGGKTRQKDVRLSDEGGGSSCSESDAAWAAAGGSGGGGGSSKACGKSCGSSGGGGAHINGLACPGLGRSSAGGGGGSSSRHVRSNSAGGQQQSEVLLHPVAGVAAAASGVPGSGVARTLSSRGGSHGSQLDRLGQL